MSLNEGCVRRTNNIVNHTLLTGGPWGPGLQPWHLMGGKDFAVSSIAHITCSKKKKIRTKMIIKTIYKRICFLFNMVLTAEICYVVIK